jgi:hypothetical protein
VASLCVARLISWYCFSRNSDYTNSLIVYENFAKVQLPTAVKLPTWCFHALPPVVNLQCRGYSHIASGGKFAWQRIFTHYLRQKLNHFQIKFIVVRQDRVYFRENLYQDFSSIPNVDYTYPNPYTPDADVHDKWCWWVVNLNHPSLPQESKAIATTPKTTLAKPFARAQSIASGGKFARQRFLRMHKTK